jgi:tRNA(fMet)-specific endonuclease VapC
MTAMKYVLDTDHLSVLQKERGIEFDTLVARLGSIPKNDRGLTIVSFHEQSRGAHAFINRAKSLEGIVRGYRLFRQILRSFAMAKVFDFDEQAAREFANLQTLRLRMSTLDLRIAAIALSHNATLLTRNAADFSRVPNLRTEDWTS